MHHFNLKRIFFYRKKKFVMCKGLCPPEMSSVIIPLHSMTGADAVSHFYGRSKKAIYEKVRRSTEAQLLISNLWKHVVWPDIKKCSTFLVKFIYDDKSSHTIAEARAKRWRGTKNKTTLRLPQTLSGEASDRSRAPPHLPKMFMASDWALVSI